ncbi:stage III sporulation protein AC [Ruminiclostridium herbifermentans]|uniref:Stage III sporulation protein AC n=1 Tax=Ruminiclostridium herbifermentans TaxID=2488810 RepID=A0A4U7JI04_9FIRM|nr:stage III sporulation protein AC [Ruminiclostridium herbifermentans]QNU65517.1 stage III sporulation protein AC [Ruminiclostridium herbifermentans]
MDGIDLIFKIAAIGIIVSVLYELLKRTGREEQAMMITLAGIVVVLMIVSKEIAGLFQAVKTMFQF